MAFIHLPESRELSVRECNMVENVAHHVRETLETTVVALGYVSALAVVCATIYYTTKVCCGG